MNPTSVTITVSELNRLTRLTIEKFIPSCWVSGEISNLTRASSGHWYFTLKDEHASVKCAFFRNRNQFMDWAPDEGGQVSVRAQATLYEPRGDYQLLVEAMRPSGQGAFYFEFLQLKAKLETEGLFLTSRKLNIPSYPKRIGVITSLQAAALQDILKTIEMHWPNCLIIIYPTPVQGANAAQFINNSLEEAIVRNECSTLIIARGGGSPEDLHPYNDEQLARTIYASSIPVITGIGHETDFTIADFVADARAPTPTAAAKLAIPDKNETQAHLQQLSSRLNKEVKQIIYKDKQITVGLSKRLKHPGESIIRTRNNIEQLFGQIRTSCTNQIIYKKLLLEGDFSNFKSNIYFLHKRIEKHEQLKLNLSRSTRIVTKNKNNQLSILINSLKQLNPNVILSRGYSIVTSLEGITLSDTKDLNIGNRVLVRLNKGHFKARIERIEED